MLDTREVCSFADFFVICSGDSERQIRAIWEEVDKVLRKEGVSLHHSEGTSDSGWVLLDFGPVIVHIFTPTLRDYYQLDRLWHNAIPLITIH